MGKRTSRLKIWRGDPAMPVLRPRMGAMLADDERWVRVGIRNMATEKKAEVGNYLSGDGGREKPPLRMYVTAVPAQSGKARYTGYWDSLLGKTYFSFDDQGVTPATRKVMANFSQMELYRFHVWPQGSERGDAEAPEHGKLAF